jgi:eukaryotic-like serine/threonine-protein kinase
VVERDADARTPANVANVAHGGSQLPRGDLTPGSLAGDYVVTELIARGGCGSVYLTRHRSIDRTAAVKVLHAPLAVLPKMVERFTREVEVVGKIRHPNIVGIYEVGTLSDRRPYYAMEHLSGRTLSAILEERGRMSPPEALAVLEPVCEALIAAHAAGVIHRDVKASNIMVDEGDPRSVKLLDFGIAKLIGPTAGAAAGGLTSDGRQVGTLTIMAPEQILGGPVDTRIDVYALGVLLYRLLTGRLPFDGKSALTLAQQHLEEPAPRPSLRVPVTPALDAIVLRCMEKRPERRHDSVRELLDALRSAALGAPRRGHADAPALGVGVYLEIRMRADDMDDALGDDIGRVLDLAEDELRREGFILAAATGSSVLGVRALPADPAGRPAARLAALRVAAALHEKVTSREGADARVHTNVCVHVDHLTLRPGDGMEVSGGALVRTGTWAPAADVLAVCATGPAVEGLADLDVLPGPQVGEGAAPLVTLVGSARRDP